MCIILPTFFWLFLPKFKVSCSLVNLVSRDEDSAKVLDYLRVTNFSQSDVPSANSTARGDKAKQSLKAGSSSIHRFLKDIALKVVDYIDQYIPMSYWPTL